MWHEELREAKAHQGSLGVRPAGGPPRGSKEEPLDGGQEGEQKEGSQEPHPWNGRETVKVMAAPSPYITSYVPT